MGKIRGNALGSSYNVYDCGKQPGNNLISGSNRKDWRVIMGKI